MNNRLFNFYIFAAILLTGGAAMLATGCQKTADKNSAKMLEGEVQASTEPEFKGGASAWLKFLNTTIRYPDEAINQEIMGTVAVKFLVSENGTVSHVTALGGHEILQREAIRVIRASGPWEPAIADGHAVSAYKTQPIVFRLEAQ